MDMISAWSMIAMKGDVNAGTMPCSKFLLNWDYRITFILKSGNVFVQPNAVYSREEYLKVSRIGRGTALSRIQRAKIWPVFEEFRAQMARAKLREMGDAMHEAIILFKEKQVQLPYSSIVVDEAQDIGAPAFTLIRSRFQSLLTISLSWVMDISVFTAIKSF